MAFRTSQQSTTTKYIQNRYKDIPVILTSLPWAPTAVILEGMFIIQTPPFPTMEHMKEYAQMLFIRYVTPHYNRNATEVHVVFDNPGGQLSKNAVTQLPLNQWITNAPHFIRVLKYPRIGERCWHAGDASRH